MLLAAGWLFAKTEQHTPGFYFTNRHPMEKPKQPETTPGDTPFKEVNMHINEFGQIVRDVKLEDINTFLNENVPDKKFEESDDDTTEAS
jgi:hypothetical protein